MRCPYQNEKDLEVVNMVSQKLFDMGCYEISLGDTNGTGTSELTPMLFEAVKLPKGLLAAHFHYTYEHEISNL